MNIIDPKHFVGSKAWDAILIEQLSNATVRLHWTDKPYRWHFNDGPEVFVVLDGEVEMHVRLKTGDAVHRLLPGQIFHAESGDEHVAHPCGEARVLVIETAGSI